MASNTFYFFDNYHINCSRTTAEFRLHHPVRRECVLVHDALWEGDGCDYHNFFYDSESGIYRMYYLGFPSLADGGKALNLDTIVVCYAESRDGLYWEKPNLGICDWDGSKDNNIILGGKGIAYGNFMVFMDTNPNCLPEEKYKGIASYNNVSGKRDKLTSYMSSDGIHFTQKEIICTEADFDTLNVAFWDEKTNKYRSYVRGTHNEPGRADEYGVRDIRYIESEDFIHWTSPVLLDYGNEAEDLGMYTNNIQPYGKGEELLYIGLPMRYVERRLWDWEWTATIDQLPGLEKRKQRSAIEQRFGMAITDCAFMCSRDGLNFKRYDEAFMRPGPENGVNWVYGDCLLARGMVETASTVRGEENELSLFAPSNTWMGIPAELYRYTIRKDGFISLHAGETEKIIVTKRFVLTAPVITANLSTSAWGHIYCSVILNSGEKVESVALFGDHTCRYIDFKGYDFTPHIGEKVALEFRLRDADLYSVSFTDEAKSK